jgi:hypothetical protein
MKSKHIAQSDPIPAPLLGQDEPAKDAEVARLKELLTASENWRQAYQDGKYKLYEMGGEICEAAATHLPMSEGPLDRAVRKAIGIIAKPSVPELQDQLTQALTSLAAAQKMEDAWKNSALRWHEDAALAESKLADMTKEKVFLDFGMSRKSSIAHSYGGYEEIRNALGTEITMHTAWRKRAEEAESKLSEAQRKLAVIFDAAVYSDSLGVHGSDFSVCRWCGGGSSPGKGDFKHNDGCLMDDGVLDQAVKEVWEEVPELRAELSEAHQEIDRLRANHGHAGHLAPVPSSADKVEIVDAPQINEDKR